MSLLLRKLHFANRFAKKMISGIKCVSCEERHRELGLLSLEKRRLSGDLITTFQRVFRNDGEGLIIRACSDRMWGMASNGR